MLIFFFLLTKHTAKDMHDLKKIVYKNIMDFTAERALWKNKFSLSLAIIIVEQ